MTKLECPIPYMGVNCTETYAQHAGSAYDTYQALYLTYGLIIFVITTTQNIRLFRIRGVKLQDYQISPIHQMFAMSWIISVTLVIRGGDPDGWADRIPQWLHEFCLGTATSSGYNLFAVGVLNWIKIIRAISGRSAEPVNRATVIIVITWYVWVFVTNTLYSVTTPAYVYSSLNLLFNVTMNIIVMSAGWFYGGSIYYHLRHAIRDLSPGPTTTTLTHTNTNTTNSNTISPPSHRGSVKFSNIRSAERSKVRVMLHLLIALTIVSLIAIAAQLHALAENIRIQYQSAFYAIDSYPTFTFSDILLGWAAFPIGQGLAALVVMLFYRKLGTPDAFARSPSSPAKHERQNTLMSIKDLGNSPNFATPTRALSRQPSNMDLGTGYGHAFLSRQQSSMLDVHITRETVQPAAITPQHRPQPSNIPSFIQSDRSDSNHALLIHMMSSPTRSDTIQQTPASRVCRLPHNVDSCSGESDDSNSSPNDIRIDMDPNPNPNPPQP